VEKFPVCGPCAGDFDFPENICAGDFLQASFKAKVKISLKA